MSFFPIYRLFQPQKKQRRQQPSSPSSLKHLTASPARIPAGAGADGSLQMVVRAVKRSHVAVRLDGCIPKKPCTLELADAADAVLATTELAPETPLTYTTLAFPEDFAPDGSNYTVRARQGDSTAWEEIKLVLVNHQTARSFATLEHFLDNKQSNDVESEVLPINQAQLDSMFQLSNADFVNYLYHWLLGREADPGGFQSHLNRLEEGITREQLINDMLVSDESIQHRRLASVRGHNDVAYPFSAAHASLRNALGGRPDSVR